ncbi:MULTISPECIES: general secretion pathway protein GspK [unclassified Thioalkalivibrio]|uniref:general secretion pathway protein GspK n=1 Tax=unclassified Thioalkalivibrio TaxID=2621013 RepID=UPI00036A711F|nr:MULTISPECIES: type II secretion system protein GspK [unclassified Thioalkalivibrio]
MALILVLWIITLLSVVAASFSLGVRRDAGAAQHLVEESQARAMAEAGVRLAMLGLAHPAREQRWAPGEGVRRTVWEGVSLEIELALESGRIDINEAPRDLLEAALAEAGVEPESMREAIAGRIIEWRGGSDPDGGGVSEYARLGLEYGPAGEPFRAVEELLLIPGIGGAEFRALRPMVTTFSGARGVDPSQAPPEVIRALPDLDQETVDRWRADRARALREERQPPDLEARHVVSGGTEVHTVRSTAQLPSGARYTVRAVIQEADSTDPEPFRIIHFRQAH